jgi:hypothetical protein
VASFCPWALRHRQISNDKTYGYSDSKLRIIGHGVFDSISLDFIRRPEEIGVQLTEGMMMDPEASVSSLVFPLDALPSGRTTGFKDH